MAALAALAPRTPAVAGDTIRAYGGGTAGSGGFVPSMWPLTTPRVGDLSFTVQVEGALGGTWGVPFVATAPADVTFLGLRVLVDPATVSLQRAFRIRGNGLNDGVGTFQIAIPSNPVLIGTPIYTQVLTLDGGAANGVGFGATQGLRLAPTRATLVVAARDRPGARDALLAIDPGTGARSDVPGQDLGDGGGITFADGGDALFAVDASPPTLHLFDATGALPSWSFQSALTAPSRPVAAVRTPDGQRVYVLQQGPPGSSPAIEAFHARGPAAGTPFPGGPIRIANLADARAMVFSHDTTTAFLGALGPFSGAGGSVTRIDVAIGSGTFHRPTGRIDFPGRVLTHLTLSIDGQRLYAAMTAFGLIGEIAVIDVATFQVIDADPLAPGLQNLGGEQYLVRTDVPLAMSRTVADPRGGVLWIGSVGGIARLVVDPAARDYRAVTFASASLGAGELVHDLVISDAGDMLFLATDREVIEFDTELLLATQRWPALDVQALAFR